MKLYNYTHNRLPRTRGGTLRTRGWWLVSWGGGPFVSWGAFWTDDIPVSHETTSLQLYEGSASPSTDETPEPQETTSVPPLYEGSALTAHSSSVLILQYKMRHQLTEEALADLLQLIKMHCPIPNQCPASVFLLKKHFPNLNYTVQLHHYCSRCMQGVDIGRHKICTNELCKTDLGSVMQFQHL